MQRRTKLQASHSLISIFVTTYFNQIRIDSMVSKRSIYINGTKQRAQEQTYVYMFDEFITMDPKIYNFKEELL